MTVLTVAIDSEDTEKPSTEVTNRAQAGKARAMRKKGPSRHHVSQVTLAPHCFLVYIQQLLSGEPSSESNSISILPAPFIEWDIRPALPLRIPP